MRKLFGFQHVAIAVLVIVGLSGGAAYAEAVGCGPEEVKKISQHLEEVTQAIARGAAAGQIDAALKLLKEFDTYYLSPDATRSRFAIAQAMYKAGRYQEAAVLLEKAYANDSYNKIMPDCLMLLCNVLYYNLKDTKSYEDYMKKLATNYYPGIPVVAQARRAFQGSGPDADKRNKVLIDESLKESSIFGRFYLGSTNFCQWDVIRVLTLNGLVVHDNGYVPGSRLTRDVMRQYGLVIINGGSSTGGSIPTSTIDEIVRYVDDGGTLLVVCASKTLGGGKQPAYLNLLMDKFDMHFNETYTTGGGTVKCTPVDHPAMSGAKAFEATFGTQVTGGTPIGTYSGTTIMSICTHGRGTVIAAGLGTGFQGNTIGDLYRTTQAQQDDAKINREFVLKLCKYLLSQAK